MPLPSYSPWEEASAGVRGMGNSLNDIALAIARSQYAQQVQQQRFAQQAEALRQRDAANQSQMALDKSRMSRLDAERAIDEEKLGSAKRFGTAMGRQVPTVNPLAIGGGPSRTNAKLMGDQDAFVNSVIEAAIASALAGNPERATDFQAKNEALRSVQPMNPRLGAAMLTNTRSVVPIPAGGGAYDVMNGVIDEIVPPRPGSGGAQAELTPNAALGARLNDEFMMLPPEMKRLIDMTVTNQVPRGVRQPMAAPVGPVAAPVSGGSAPPPPQARPVGMMATTAKGTFRWNGQSWDQVK